MNATVIGSGVAGIASAIRLTKLGFKVKVFEANAFPGGKLSSLEDKGYTFDAGPSVFTMPEKVDELFQFVGKNPRQYFNYEKLDETFRYFYSDGTRLNLQANPEQIAKEIEENIGVSAKHTLQFLEKSRYIFEKNRKLFLESSLHKLKSYLNKDTLNALANIHKFGLFKSMNEVNKKKLNHPKLTQLFNRYATYNGSSPFKAPAILNLIAHLELNEGIFFPEGSMISITNSLVKLAEEQGVDFHYNSKVDEILLNKKKAKGVRVGDTEYLSDVVVSNSDVYHTYTRLLKNLNKKPKALKQERSSSAVIFYLGINREFKELGLHNVFFGDQYEQEFNDVFRHKKLTDDPTIYVNITSKHNPDDAPSGCENWFVFITAPSLNAGQDWTELTQKAYELAISKLNRQLKVNIEDFIVTKQFLNPLRIIDRTNSFTGSIYGTSSNSRMAAFFRHPNFSRKIKNLYFCGGSVHPGGGVPISISSAKITTEIIANDFGISL